MLSKQFGVFETDDRWEIGKMLSQLTFSACNVMRSDDRFIKASGFLGCQRGGWFW
jgi:hypothetical protein